RHAAADIGQNLARRILFALKLNREISCLPAHRIGCVKRSGWIDKKSSARNFAVLVDAVNLHNRLPDALKDVLDLAADGRSGLFLSLKQRARREENQREDESGD